MGKISNYIASIAALAVLSCANPNRIVENYPIEHSQERVGEIDPECFVRRHTEYCSEDPDSMECRYPVLSRDCYTRVGRRCIEDLVIVRSDADGDGIFELEEVSTSNVRGCVDYTVERGQE